MLSRNQHYGCVRVQPMNTTETQFKPELPLAPRTQKIVLIVEMARLDRVNPLIALLFPSSLQIKHYRTNIPL